MGGGKQNFSSRNIQKSLQSANTITIESKSAAGVITTNIDRPPRGHKQKGSGNVIVAKAPVITSDGIVLRAHERLPTMLLLEYCQREKRPNPQYYPRAPGHRHTVRLPDKKDTKFDLNFLPKDTDFESVKVAKDFAALLALFELQRNMPLENKLPSPYCDSWKAMMAATKEKAGSNKVGGRAGTSAGGAGAGAAKVAAEKDKGKVERVTSSAVGVMTAAAPISSEENDGVIIGFDDETMTSTATALRAMAVASLDSDTSDWLCCGCNTQNFAKLQSGKARTKCFKCGDERTLECEIVASTAKVAVALQPAVTSFKVAPDESSSFGFSEPKKGVADRNAGLGGKQFKVGKSTPQARLNLENKHKANSSAELERLQIEVAAAKKRQRSYWDAVQRANRPSTVILIPQLRFQLEAVLGLSGGSGGGRSEAHEKKSDSDFAFSTVVEYVASLEATKVPLRLSGGGGEGVGLIPEEECGLPVGEQRAAMIAIGTLLAAQGFRETAVVQSFVYLRSQYEEVLDELAGASSEGGARRWQKLVLDAMLEHLCLTLDNAALPKHFDARRNEGQLQVSIGGRKASPLDVKPEVAIEGESEAMRSSRSFIWEYGWSAEEATAVLTPDTQHLPALMLLQSSTQNAARLAGGAECLLPTMSTSINGIDTDISWLEAVQDEVEILISIFGDTRAVDLQVNGDCCTVSIPIQLLDAIIGAPRRHFLSESLDNASARLDVVVHKDMCYPNRTPLLLLSSSAARNAKVLLPMQLGLWQKGAELTGDSLIYQTVLYLEEVQGGIVESILCSPLCAPDTPVGIVSALARVRAGETFFPPKPPTTKDSILDNTSLEEDSSNASKTSSVRHKVTEDSKRKHPFWSRDPRDRGPLLLSKEEATKKAQKAPVPGNRSPRERDAWLAMLKIRQKLPAWNARESFLTTILQTRGMVVTGETGCGKTTQIPQFLLEVDKNCKILVCQPRRLAATGVANRVAQEMACVAGETVGYMVRGDSACGAHTRLAFCTYGVLLRRLLQDPELNGVDYVVLDEVHERGIDSDFALGLLAAALGRTSCRFKLILMSATISTDKFASYLGRAIAGAFVQGASAEKSYHAAPILHIPGYTFAVTEYYKNDFEIALRSDINLSAGSTVRGDNDDNWDSGGGGGARIGGPGRAGDLDYDLLVRCCMRLAIGDGSGGMFERATGSVLVFLPGVPEISRFCMLLRDAWGGIGGGTSSENGAPPPKGGGRGGAPSLRIIPLHAGTPSREQQRIFADARPGELKIIAATNVAEASITIPDVSVVLDSCRVKETDFDPEKQMNALTLKFASKDSLRQRRGRAGRVSEGRCFRAITSHTHASLMNHSIPEILRASLDSLVLQIKSMGAGLSQQEPCSLQLARCPDPPAEQSVTASEGMLTRMQALDTEGNITPLGSHLAALPCAPRVGRMLVYGCLLGCALPLANVAALLSARSPFIAPGQEKDDRDAMEAIKVKLGKAAGGRSDQLLIVAACAGFERCNGAAAQHHYCAENMLSFARMMEIRQLTRELLGDLATIGLIGSAREGQSLDSSCNINVSKPRVVAAAVSAGLYPQIARIMRPPKRFEEVMGSALEKNASSKEIKFYVPESVHSQWVGGNSEEVSDIAALSTSAGNELNPRSGGGGVKSDAAENGSKSDVITDGMFRVFVHPSSIHFGNNSFGASQYVMYGETRLQQSAPGRDSKCFIQDLTEVSAFPLLFFGGRLDAQYLQGTITVDGWLRFSASGKLVALIQSLRRALDALLTEKIENPGVDHSNHPLLVVLAEMLNSVDGLR